MKQLFIFAFIFILWHTPLFAQSPFTPFTQKLYGGMYEDEPESLLQCNGKDLYILVNSGSGIGGNKTVPSYPGGSYWLIKTDTSFSQWYQRSYGGFKSDHPYNLLELYGDIYLIGESDSGISGNKTVDTYGEDDIWVIKIDDLGHEIWQKSYGGSSIESMNTNSVVAVNNTLIYAVSSNSNISGNKTGNCRGNDDVWVFCTDTAGNVLWDKTYGGNTYESEVTITYSETNHRLYVLSSSLSDASFEKTEDAIGSWDLWLLEINPENGDLIKEKTLGSTEEDISSDVLIHNNHIYCLSFSYGNASGHKTEDARGETDLWLLKLDFDFNVIWDKTIGGEGSDFPHQFIKYQNNLLMVSQSNSNAGYEKTENGYQAEDSDYLADIWYVLLNEEGNVLWDKTIGSECAEVDPRILLLNDVLYSAISIYDAEPSYDFNVTDFGDSFSDVLLFKMKLPENSAVKPFQDNKVEIYPNPANQHLNIDGINQETEVLIYALDGRLILTETIQSDTRIPTETFHPGAYIVKLKTKDAIISSQTLMINH